MTETCYTCGVAAESVSEIRPFRIGNRSAEVLQEFMRCPACGEEFLLPGQMTEIQRRAASAIRASEGLLEPDRIRSIRERLGLSQGAFEKLLGVGPKTVVRWERGTVFQGKAADSLLRVVEALPSAARILAGLHDVELKPREEPQYEVGAELRARVRTVITSLLHGGDFQRAADRLRTAGRWQTSGVDVVVYHGHDPWLSTSKADDSSARNRISEWHGVG